MLSLKSFSNSWRNSYISCLILIITPRFTFGEKKIWYSIKKVSKSSVHHCRYEVLFYLWRIGSVLKHCKVPKSYDKHFLKIFFFALYTVNDHSSFWKAIIWLKKVCSIKKLPKSKVKSFLKSNINLNQTCK